MIRDSGQLTSMTPQVVELPWAAWHGDNVCRLGLPPTWHCDVLAPYDGPAWSPNRISDALQNPLETRPLWEQATGKRSACVVVDDLTRPTQTAEILPLVLIQLKRVGIRREATTVVVATGTHGGMDEPDIRRKVGTEVASSTRVEVHDATSAVAPTGILYGDRELKLNRTFLQAEFKVAVGSVLPHAFAGYSGGAKLMLPGLADVAATARSHKFVQMGLRGGQNPDKNRFRMEIEQLARRIGLHDVICVVPNRRRETAGLFAGDVVAAHRGACRMARIAYATTLRDTYDCLILNAYPKDVDLVQAESVWTALKPAKRPLLREGGLYVIATAATRGVGHHGLFGPGGASYREPRPLAGLRGAELWVYAPAVEEKQARKVYWSGYRFFRDSQALSEALAERLPEGAKAAILPCAPIQQIQDERP